MEASDLVVGTSAAAKKAGGELIDEAELGAGMEDLPDGAAKQFDYDVAAGVKGSAARAAKGACCRAAALPGVGMQAAAGGRLLPSLRVPTALRPRTPAPQAWARARRR